MEIIEYYDEATGVKHHNGTFILPSAAHRDKHYLEWIYGRKAAASITLEDFDLVIKDQFARRTQDGGISGFAAFNARSTGFAQVGQDEEIHQQIEKDAHSTEENIKKLEEHYGKDALDKMSPKEFY